MHPWSMSAKTAASHIRLWLGAAQGSVCRQKEQQQLHHTDIGADWHWAAGGKTHFMGCVFSALQGQTDMGLSVRRPI